MIKQLKPSVEHVSNKFWEQAIAEAFERIKHTLRGELMIESASLRRNLESGIVYVLVHLDYTQDFSEETMSQVIAQDASAIHAAIMQLNLDVAGAFILPYLIKPGNNVLFEPAVTFKAVVK